MNLKNLVILASGLLMVASCKKKPDQSSVTGWNYNDSKMGGFQVSKEKEQRTGPGLVFVQGGTFTMGATQEDVMRDWNNVPRRVTVNSFYIDQTEVANIHYREYLSGSTSFLTPMSTRLSGMPLYLIRSAGE